MYKMVVCEFTKALIDSEEAIAHSTMIEIDRLRREKDIKFVVMSNDSFTTMYEYNRDFPFIDYIIAYNGGYVFDIENDRVIYKKGVGISVIKKAYRLFNDMNVIFHTLDYDVYLGEYDNSNYGRPLKDFAVFSEVHRNNVYKISVICDEKSQVMRVLKAFDDYDINANTRIVKKNGRVYVEIISKINDKILGLRKIAKMNKVSLEEVIGIVGSDTDLKVSQEIGKCFVVRNAGEKIRNAVGNVVGSNDEKGVEQVLKNYL